ncbi:hypothetical protein [Verrucosispora sp. WMMC514]|uniref:hypothetical protein n=1 Tax=Verrucosispora sp. WMMC514 TaxID=3015156 RepID=UPI00248C366D|nr:hypothetical protein [Verrucosispora sp. WMMC514]WBB94262.1 hypothetical protein O7597_15535 [Verrucosispora sp. WMMC514]
MTALPAGVGWLGTVLLPTTATVGSTYHRPGAAGCERVGDVELRAQPVVLALGIAGRPCVDCWPPVAEAPAVVSR